jgi:DNA-binding IclR family transcriptional regulator
MFILSCIVEHESVSAPHIAEATRYPNEICRIYLDKFLEAEMVREDDGLYRITTHWHRAVVRTLRRRNILTV